MACIARSRTSRQHTPSFTSAGAPMIDGGRDLDRLQDDPVGRARRPRRRRRRRSTATHAAWKTPRFDGVAGSDGGDVDGEEHGGGGADAGRVVEAERDEQDVAGEPLQDPRGELRDRGERAEPRVAEHAQAVAHLHERAARRRDAAGRARAARRRRRAAPAREHHERAPRSAPRATSEQRACGRVKRSTVENITAPSIDEREDVEQRLRDDRAEHDRAGARAGGRSAARRSARATARRGGPAAWRTSARR